MKCEILTENISGEIRNLGFLEKLKSDIFDHMTLLILDNMAYHLDMYVQKKWRALLKMRGLLGLDLSRSIQNILFEFKVDQEAGINPCFLIFYTLPIQRIFFKY